MYLYFPFQKNSYNFILTHFTIFYKKDYIFLVISSTIFEAALAIKPNAIMYQELGKLLEQLGEDEMAAKCFRSGCLQGGIKDGDKT